VTGTISIKTQPVDVLFNSDAMYSSISIKLVEALRLVPTSRHSLLPVALPNGKRVRCDELYNDWPTQIDVHVLLSDSYKFSLTDIDVFLGMD